MCTKKSIQLSKTAMHFPVGKANTFYFLNLVQSLSHLMTGPDMSRQLWLLHGSIVCSSWSKKVWQQCLIKTAGMHSQSKLGLQNTHEITS